MENQKKQSIAEIKAVFDSQAFAVLATQKDGQPYTSLLAVKTTADLKQILFLTPSTTRKFENLLSCPNVALLIHNSMNKASDIFNAISVTATGKASPANPDQKEQLLPLLLEQHPSLAAFADLPTTELICVTVHSYVLVSKFQEVVEIDMA